LSVRDLKFLKFNYGHILGSLLFITIFNLLAEARNFIGSQPLKVKYFIFPNQKRENFWKLTFYFAMCYKWDCSLRKCKKMKLYSNSVFTACWKTQMHIIFNQPVPYFSTPLFVSAPFGLTALTALRGVLLKNRRLVRKKNILFPSTNSTF